MLSSLFWIFSIPLAMLPLSCSMVVWYRVSRSRFSFSIRKNRYRYRAITTVKAGMTFDHIATAHNGWNAIVINGQVGWVSGKYSRVV